MNIICVTNLKTLKLSYLKIIIYAKQLKNKNYKKILYSIKFFPTKIRNFFWKLVSSSFANINQFYWTIRENFLVYQIYATKAKKNKRMQARAKGRSYYIFKHYSHLFIKLKINKINKFCFLKKLTYGS